MKTNIRTEDARYEAIREATIACADQEYFDKYYRDTGKRWLDIARLWDKLFTCSKHFVLTSVVHKIMWGVHPYQSDDADFVHLLALVEEEVLRDGEAYQEWAKWRTFKNVLSAVTDSTVSLGRSNLDAVFITHYHYLRARAMREIMYTKNSCHELDLCSDICTDYEAAVALLVPASKQWTYQQWGDSRVLVNELKNLYGMDFFATWDSQRAYDRLIKLIYAWNREALADQYWYATNIEELPEGIVQRIWPNNAAGVLADILINAYALLKDYEKAGSPFAERKIGWIDPLYHFDRSAFKHSWIHKYVAKQYYQDVYQGDVEKQLKRIIFDLETTVD